MNICMKWSSNLHNNFSAYRTIEFVLKPVIHRQKRVIHKILFLVSESMNFLCGAIKNKTTRSGNVIFWIGRATYSAENCSMIRENKQRSENRNNETSMSSQKHEQAWKTQHASSIRQLKDRLFPDETTNYSYSHPAFVAAWCGGNGNPERLPERQSQRWSLNWRHHLHPTVKNRCHHQSLRILLHFGATGNLLRHFFVCGLRKPVALY